MPLKRRKERQTHSKVLSSAKESADRLVDDEIAEELARTGTVWSGLLDLRDPIHPTVVAAMLSSYELIKATRFIDSDPHWSDAACFAAIGAFCEKSYVENDHLSGRLDDEEDQLPIGFLPGHTTSPRN